jgi:hypothetical protein
MYRTAGTIIRCLALCPALLAGLSGLAKANFVFDKTVCQAFTDRGGSADCVGPNGSVVRIDLSSDGCHYHQQWTGFDGCPDLEKEPSSYMSCSQRSDVYPPGSYWEEPLVWWYDYDSEDSCSPDQAHEPRDNISIFCGCAVPELL